MPNTNPQAIKFSNEKVRVMAELMIAAIETARSFAAFYSAEGGDTLFPNDAELIVDGSATDGRPPVQNQMARAMKNQADGLVTWATTGNPTPETRFRGISDKGDSKF